VFGSSLDVAIGLIFVYFLLAVIVSHVNEIIAGAFSWRAAALEDGIRHLLADGDLADRVLKHPLIARLSGKEGRRPSQIPSQLFARAVFDVLVPPPPTPGSTPDEAAIANAVDLAAAKLPDPAKATLVSILRQAGPQLAQKRAAVEAWFDDAMDRLSGVYKRQVQWVTLGLGALAVVVLNVDTIAIASALWHDQGIRAAVTGAAQQASGAMAMDNAVNTLYDFGLPIGWSVLPIDAAMWGMKAAGLALSILAVSLGAPFWFDLLNRLANLRASGPKPETAAERAEKAQSDKSTAEKK